jgi:hypothetical protein
MVSAARCIYVCMYTSGAYHMTHPSATDRKIEQVKQEEENFSTTKHFITKIFLAVDWC